MFDSGEKIIGPDKHDPGKLETRFDSPHKADAVEIEAFYQKLRTGGFALQKSHAEILKKGKLSLEDYSELARILARLVSHFTKLFGRSKNPESFIRAYFEGLNSCLNGYFNKYFSEDSRMQEWEKGFKAMYQYVCERLNALEDLTTSGKIEGFNLAHQGRADAEYGIDVFEAIQKEGLNRLRLVQIENSDNTLSSVYAKHSAWGSQFTEAFPDEDSLRVNLLQRWASKEQGRHASWNESYGEEKRLESLSRPLTASELIQAVFGATRSNESSARGLFEEMASAIFCVPALQELLYAHIEKLFNSAAENYLSQALMDNLVRAEKIVRLMTTTKASPYDISSVTYVGNTKQTKEKMILDKTGHPLHFYSLTYQYPEKI